MPRRNVKIKGLDAALNLLHRTAILKAGKQGKLAYNLIKAGKISENEAARQSQAELTNLAFAAKAGAINPKNALMRLKGLADDGTISGQRYGRAIIELIKAKPELADFALKEGVIAKKTREFFNLQQSAIAKQRLLISKYPERLRAFDRLQEKFDDIIKANQKPGREFCANFLKAMYDLGASGNALAVGLKERGDKAGRKRLRKGLAELAKRRNSFSAEYIKQAYPG